LGKVFYKYSSEKTMKIQLIKGSKNFTFSVKSPE
jgi:hypothetical protein